MFPFRSILVPTDFTAALKYAAAFARHSGGRVFLFGVQGHGQELLGDPLLGGVDKELILIEGESANEVAQRAIDHEIDLITVVMRGRNRLSRAFGNSIAEEIVAESPCAVLAVRPQQRDFIEDGKIRLKRVLLATNFRPSSVAATQLATQIANQLGAELHAIYVQERMEHLSHGSGGAETHIAEGRPYQEIVKLADTLDAELIVIGTAVHGSLFGSSQVLGSEIERVIRNAPCPVLCVPAARVVTPLPALVTQVVPQM